MKTRNKIGIENETVDPLFNEDCTQEILKNFDLSYGPPTKFPEVFDPKAHNMVDISELLAARLKLKNIRFIQLKQGLQLSPT